MVRGTTGTQPTCPTGGARSEPVWLRALFVCVLLIMMSPAAVAQVGTPFETNVKGKAKSSFTTPAPKAPVRKIDQAQPLYLQGDELIYDSRGNTVAAKGNVEIYFNNFILTADEVVYDQSAHTLTAVGNVTLKEPNGNIVRAERYVLTDDFRDGFIQQLSIIATDDTRIAAERATRRDGNITEFQNGKFSPCKNDPGQPPLWCISAAQIIHDQAAATITYHDAQFELFGVPIAYLPYFQHADPSVKRRTGFLVPEIGTSSRLGFMLEVPYFFALNPSYDFTFHPRYTSKHGMLWQGDWRHRVSFGGISGIYDIKAAGIDQDYTTLPLVDRFGTQIDPRPELDGWRGTIETKGRFSLSSWWNFGWDVILESDDDFRRFYGFDNILQTDRVNRVFLAGLSDRNYFSVTGYHFGGLLLTDTPLTESRVHPIVDWNYIVDTPMPVVGGELSWNVNAISMSRSEEFMPAPGQRHSSEFNRITGDINWRRKLTDRIGITYTPFANLRGDAFQVMDVIDPSTLQYVSDETLVRGVASAGVLASYPWIAHTAYASHIIEPIGQIIGRTASADQRRIPIEDSRSLVFDDTNLFELDKFSGYDLVETGTRANVGLQYTFQTNWGGYARLLAGQSFHLAGENAFANPGQIFESHNAWYQCTLDPLSPDCLRFRYEFSPGSGLQRDASDYVLAAYLAPSSAFRVIGQTRFSEDNFALQRADLYGRLAYGPLQAMAVYTYMSADTLSAAAPITTVIDDQHDVFTTLGLRITDHWSVGYGLRYDLDDAFKLQEQFQIRYADECFVLTATYTETNIRPELRATATGTTLDDDRSIMLRFELRHLGEYKYKTDVLDFAFGDNQPNPTR